MCAPVVAALTVASGVTQAYGDYKSGIATQKYNQYQADVSRQQGALGLQQAEIQSRLIQDSAKGQGKQLKTNQAEFNASQRAALSAAGVNGVTAQDIVSDTFNKQQLDEQTLRYNADVKAWEVNTNAANQNWALNEEANQFEQAGKNAKKAGKTKVFSTLLSTASSVGSNFLKKTP